MPVSLGASCGYNKRSALMIHLHVDIDNIWNYEREYNCTPSDDHDSIFDQAMPLMLELFERYQIKSTFFVVGKDAERASCQDFCRQAVAAGHEIANHTYSHPSNLSQLSYNEKEREIRVAHELLESVTNKAIIGFRAPGYYLDDDIREILISSGYLYDSSVLPSFVSQLMGLFISLRAGRKLSKSFGRNRYFFVAQKVTRVYSRIYPGSFFYEVPIFTFPVLRLPVHSTFLYLLGGWYAYLVRELFRFPFKHKVFLLHAIDTLDYKGKRELSAKVPPLRLSLKERLLLVEPILAAIQAQVPMTTAEWLSTLNPLDVPRSTLLSLSMRVRTPPTTGA